MKTRHVAFVVLATLLALAPSAAALAAELPEEETCIYKTEPCWIGSGTVLVTCTNPEVRVPLCFI